MFKPGSVYGRHGVLQIQTRELIKSIRITSNFTSNPWLEMAKEGTVHSKNMQSNKLNIIQQKAQPFYKKFSDAIPFLIINIFKGNCYSITQSFSITVTYYNYFYFGI